MNRRRARAKTPGSLSATHAILGPTAWLVSAEPQRSTIAASPNRPARRAICSPARVSTPYRIAGRSGSPSAPASSVHGPIPLTPTHAMSVRPLPDADARELTGQLDELLPPHARVHLDVAGRGAVHRVLPRRCREQPSVERHEDALAPRRADVDTEHGGHRWLLIRRDGDSPPRRRRPARRRLSVCEPSFLPDCTDAETDYARGSIRGRSAGRRPPCAPRGCGSESSDSHDKAPVHAPRPSLTVDSRRSEWHSTTEKSFARQSDRGSARHAEPGRRGGDQCRRVDNTVDAHVGAGGHFHRRSMGLAGAALPSRPPTRSAAAERCRRRPPGAAPLPGRPCGTRGRCGRAATRLPRRRDPAGDVGSRCSRRSTKPNRASRSTPTALAAATGATT